MLQIAYFSHSNISTSETFIEDLVRGLNADSNIQITFVSGALAPQDMGANIKSFSTGFADRYKVAVNRIHRIGQFIGNKGDDWSMKFNQKVALRQLEKARTPKFDVAYVEYATTGVLVMNYLEKTHVPFILHVHGYDVTTCLNDKAYATQLQILFEKAVHIIAPSNHIRRFLITIGCKPSKISTLYPVTNLTEIPISKIDKKQIDPTLIFLGRLTDKKNPLALIYALNLVRLQVPNVRLKILGDGPLRQQVETLIKKLDLGNQIELLGVVNRETAFNFLTQAHVYVQHSVTSTNGDQEGFPVSLAEAAAHSLPLVSTIHSGITENVIEGKTGYLVQEYDYETMADRIIYLLTHPDLAEQMGKAGREHIMKLCKPGKRVETIKYLIESIAKKTNISENAETYNNANFNNHT